MVLKSQGEYDSQWAVICSIAPKTGCTPETLHVWVGDADDFLDISGDDTCLLKKKKSAPLSFISNKVRSWLPSYANWATLRKEICGVGSVHGKPVAEQKNPFVIRPVTQMSKTGCR